MSLAATTSDDSPAAGSPPGRRPPLFSLSRSSPFHTDPAALAAYYQDRGLMWRNILFIGIANLGWGLALGVIGPLIIMKLVDLGVGQGIQNTIGTVNSGLLSILVMLFSWMSDHTISRLGRRKPYFFISAPFLIVTILLFPFMAVPSLVWLVVAMQIVFKLFMDLKQSTFSLISIDCMPRNVLARMLSIFGIIGGITGFLVNYNAGWLISCGESVPYIVAGCVMVVTTLCALLVKEPPVYHPPTERFKLWSTFKISASDKRIFILMLGVALIGTYGYSTILLNTFWAYSDLHLSAKDILQATSWAGLSGMLLAYPIGWIIDRFGGLKVVLAYFVLSTACFLFQLHVHTKMGLTQLAVAATLFGPLYGAADIMVYKSCREEDIGSITSTNAFMRNMAGMCLGFLITMSVAWVGSRYQNVNKYHVGFIIGEIFSALGMLLFFVYAWSMRKAPKQRRDVSSSHPAAEPLVLAAVAEGAVAELEASVSPFLEVKATAIDP
jgi:MFS family permease